MRLRTCASLAAAMLAVVVPVGAAPAAAQGPPPSTAAAGDYAFAFADQPTASNYAAHPRLSTNSTGATNTVTRHGVGDYSVRMPGLGAAGFGGNAQVTAYGTNSNRCKVSYWVPSEGDMYVGVVCHNTAGNRADTQFTVQYHRDSNNPAHQSAYLLASPSSTGVPDSRYSYNSKGGNNYVTKQGTGVWRVEFGSGFTQFSGVIHVTAYGSGSQFCTARAWGQRHADVRCYNASGNPTDTSWSLRYHDQHLPNGFAELGGYVWGNGTLEAEVGDKYQPHPQHSFNMNNGTNELEKLAVGRYRVTFGSIPAFDEGNPMVSAHWQPGVYCKVRQLNKSGSSSAVYVDCRNASGQFTDSTFTLSQVTNQ